MTFDPVLGLEKHNFENLILNVDVTRYKKFIWQKKT
jgi:hypothetical protein